MKNFFQNCEVVFIGRIAINFASFGISRMQKKILLKTSVILPLSKLLMTVSFVPYKSCISAISEVAIERFGADRAARMELVSLSCVSAFQPCNLVVSPWR